MAAFMVAYGLFEMPWGSWATGSACGTSWRPLSWAARRSRPRCRWWSCCLRRIAWIFSSCSALRFLFGAFQAGTFPSISRMMADWIPVNERGGAQGLLWMSSRIGGATAPSLLVWLFHVMGDWKGPLS